MGVITPSIKHFLSAEKFAVIGSVITDPTRWDYKVLRWYKDRGLAVTPVRYNRPGDQVEGLEIIGDPTLLPDLSKTSLSIIIRPSSGLEILSRLFPTPATGHEPHGVWFQPGADDSSIAEFVRARGLEDKVVLGGRCVLVDGDRGLQAVAEEKNEGSKL
ncbi:hypothetical protein DB88DRAFT_217745 [Papiliotrema laurentii]|uniref:CoA-binding domain-containing protein n=1 Tax=Papiliotrema laurentii TaxID=5418 RepID=A0AAD9L7G7_PAPLA|nr:hypothetical protein DB88DRAFT_217745 [Papiliotrema laurentii]